MGATTSATLQHYAGQAAGLHDLMFFSHEHAIAFDVLIQSGARPIQSSVQRNRRSRCPLWCGSLEQERVGAGEHARSNKLRAALAAQRFPELPRPTQTGAL